MNHLKKFFLASGLVCWLCLLSFSAFSGEIEILVKKLVDKGILTHGEAQQVLTETKEEVRREIAEGSSASLPSWLQNIKLKGDLRVRYQWDGNSSAIDRHRGRVRYRLGLEAKVNPKLSVTAGLASGGSDPRSTNQTFSDSFDTGDIRLDYAMAQWHAAPWAAVRMGKLAGVRKQVMAPTDLLWDSDINPEGGSLLLSKDVTKNLNLFMNTGLWVLDESSSVNNDPYMAVVQPGFKVKFPEIDFIGEPSLKMATAFYSISNESRISDHSSGTNTKDGGVLRYQYDSISPSLELSLKNPFGAIVPYAALFAEGIHNPDPKDDNNGFAVGLKFGDSKISDWGNWQLQYLFRRLERDAWLDIFPDSDAFGGRTDVKGHEVVLKYGLGKNTSIGIDWYSMSRIQGSGTNNIVQVDWSIKF
jgi:polyhydroxyalkanoate synthesis regulator phasin